MISAATAKAMESTLAELGAAGKVHRLYGFVSICFFCDREIAAYSS